jgi:hypothetical protein
MPKTRTKPIANGIKTLSKREYYRSRGKDGIKDREQKDNPKQPITRTRSQRILPQIGRSYTFIKTSEKQRALF